MSGRLLGLSMDHTRAMAVQVVPNVAGAVRHTVPLEGGSLELGPAEVDRIAVEDTVGEDNFVGAVVGIVAEAGILLEALDYMIVEADNLAEFDILADHIHLVPADHSRPAVLEGNALVAEADHHSLVAVGTESGLVVVAGLDCSLVEVNLRKQSVLRFTSDSVADSRPCGGPP